MYVWYLSLLRGSIEPPHPEEPKERRKEFTIIRES
jgi:hypothetical protein